MNLSSILNWIDAEYNHYKSLSEDEPSYITEQSIWRIQQVKEKSPKCLEQSGCVRCGCMFPEKSFESEGCGGGCYPKRMNKDEWNNFKLKNNINGWN